MMIKSAPLLGIGLNNYLSRLPDFKLDPTVFRLFQPVHNIFLLTAAETGLMGLSLFLFLVIKSLKNSLDMPASRDSFGMRNWSLVISLLVILSTGCADHYWLTLQQTQLLLAIVLGLSWQQIKKEGQ
jgi:O-antigen ligase